MYKNKVPKRSITLFSPVHKNDKLGTASYQVATPSSLGSASVRTHAQYSWRTRESHSIRGTGAHYWDLSGSWLRSCSSVTFQLCSLITVIFRAKMRFLWYSWRRNIFQNVCQLPLVVALTKCREQACTTERERETNWFIWSVLQEFSCCCFSKWTLRTYSIYNNDIIFHCKWHSILIHLSG